MRQCELAKVIQEKGESSLTRTGEVLVAFLNVVTPEMVGAIIELKKVPGLWIVDKVDEKEIERYEVKRNWYVRGI